MLENFLPYFQLNGHSVEIEGDALTFGEVSIPVRNNIPRFTPDQTYVSGNFSKLRERHKNLQLDSANGTTDRLDTILMRTNWPRDFFKGKVVLECGCGAGPDTEILLNLGARVVAVDLTGLDVARSNLGDHPDLCLVQASIDRLPFKKNNFDIVYCHRVIMHTPDPEKVLNHILQFAKPTGAAFVHSYSRDFLQMARWKYLVRPLTKRMDPEKLYKLIEGCAPYLYRFTNVLNKNRIGRRLAWIFIPFINHRYKEKFDDLSDARMIEYATHETFDAMSPYYDRPLSYKLMERIARKHLKQSFEIVHGSAITLLRTVVNEYPATPTRPTSQ